MICLSTNAMLLTNLVMIGTTVHLDGPRVLLHDITVSDCYRIAATTLPETEQTEYNNRRGSRSPSPYRRPNGPRHDDRVAPEAGRRWRHVPENPNGIFKGLKIHCFSPEGGSAAVTKMRWKMIVSGQQPLLDVKGRESDVVESRSYWQDGDPRSRHYHHTWASGQNGEDHQARLGGPSNYKRAAIRFGADIQLLCDKGGPRQRPPKSKPEMCHSSGMGISVFGKAQTSTPGYQGRLRDSVRFCIEYLTSC
jgi:hypothetical protein